jgi:hypothetical protein
MYRNNSNCYIGFFKTKAASVKKLMAPRKNEKSRST